MSKLLVLHLVPLSMFKDLKLLLNADHLKKGRHSALQRHLPPKGRSLDI